MTAQKIHDANALEAAIKWIADSGVYVGFDLNPPNVGGAVYSSGAKVDGYTREELIRALEKMRDGK